MERWSNWPIPSDIRDEILTDVRKNKVVVAEFGQAYWLDKRHGFTPNVTASHTTSPELFLFTGIPAQEVTTVGCCKAYDTKVGTHHFITQIDHLSDPLKKTCKIRIRYFNWQAKNGWVA